MSFPKALIMTFSPATLPCLGIFFMWIPRVCVSALGMLLGGVSALNSRKGNGEIRSENTTARVRMWMSARVWAISHFLREEDELMPLHTELCRVTCYRYTYWTCAFGEHCKNKTPSRRKNFRRSRATGTWASIINMVHINSKASPWEPEPTAQQLAVTNGCRWMASVPCCRASPVVSSPRISFRRTKRAVVRPGIITLNAAVG